MKGKRSRLEDGFTMIEMLVSVVIFAIIVVAVYFFFDRGQWLYLKSQRRANMQENGRLAMEALEREMRLISFGVPYGTSFTDETVWLPAVFKGGASSIGFRGDVDNNNSLVKSDVGASATSLTVELPESACPEDDYPILIVQRGRNWAPYECSNVTATSIDIDPAAGRTYLASEIEVFTPDHVFYRLTPDANADGECDATTVCSNPPYICDYSQCIIQRAFHPDDEPIDESTPGLTLTWETFATNIQRFELQYFIKGDPPIELTTLPLTGADLSYVDMIRINLTARDRSDKPQEYQDAKFVSDILIRKRKF